MRHRHALTMLPLLAAALCGAGSSLAQDSEFTFPMRDGDSPRLTAVNIEGNDRTRTEVILRLMDLETGAPLTLDQTDRAWDRLEDSGFFRFVEIDYDDEADDEVVLNVRVEEDLTTYYGPVARYDRRFKYQVGAYLEERNFRGRAERVRLEAVGLYNQEARLSWERPWLLGVRGLRGRIAVGAGQGDFVFRPTRFRKWDASAGLHWKFRAPLFLEIGATRGRFEQRDGFGWPDPTGGPDPVANPAGSASHWLLEAALGLDTRSNPYYPRRGVFAEARLRRWTGDGFDDYLESVGDLRLFVPIPWGQQILALRGWGRRTDGPAQLDNRLYFGGPGTVRGLPFASREGDEGWLLSAEYRIPLFLMPISPKGELVGFGLHAFADAGDAWSEGADPGRAQQSAGAGAHLNLDTLQFRFECARTSGGDWRFEFFDRFNF